MARYRKVDVRVWVDEKFRRLTPLQPSGQALWLYLITNPATTNVPGLYRAGEAAMAEELGWSLEAFREAFAEAFREGLAEADWKARVIWLPGGPKYNRPESANVVKSWATAWDEIPDCTLKAKAFSALKAFTEALGKGFAEAFAKACRKPSVKPWPNPEPEPEQEPESAPRARDPGPDATEHVPPSGEDRAEAPASEGNGHPRRTTAHDVLTWFGLEWRDVYQRFWKPDRGSSDAARDLVENEIPALPPDEREAAYADIRPRIRRYLADRDPGITKHAHPFKWFCDRFNALAAASEPMVRGLPGAHPDSPAAKDSRRTTRRLYRGPEFEPR